MNRKVCVWCERWGAGGIESFVVNMLSSMDKSGMDITILTAQKESEVFDHRLKELGIALKPLLTEDDKNSMTRTLKVFGLLREELSKEKYDTIHLNIYHGLALYYAKIAKDCGVEVRIAHSHNSALRPSLTRPLKAATHRLSGLAFTKYATHLCACSKVAGDWMFPKACRDRVTLIANGVDTKRFEFDKAEREKTRQQLGIGSSHTYCCVGRICSQKNQTFLIEVFGQLLKLDPKAILYLAGSEDDGGAARELAGRLGIEKAVVFLGVIPWISQLLWACDGFVLPSVFEGNPVSAIEAQASGIACFLSDSISKEADVSGNVRFISLNCGAEAWAKELFSGVDYERHSARDKLIASGYDAAISAENLRKLYMRLT